MFDSVLILLLITFLVLVRPRKAKVVPIDRVGVYAEFKTRVATEMNYAFQKSPRPDAKVINISQGRRKAKILTFKPRTKK